MHHTVDYLVVQHSEVHLCFCAESERDNTELTIPIIQLHMIFTGYMTGYIRSLYSLLYNIIIIFYTTEPMETIFHSNMYVYNKNIFQIPFFFIIIFQGFTSKCTFSIGDLMQYQSRPLQPFSCLWFSG